MIKLIEQIPLPINRCKDEILHSLDNYDFLIIKSSPGSGKTTLVPVFLQEKYKKKIYILEPRKLAAKLASTYVSQHFNENPGGKVGHIFKYEKKVGNETKIIYLTEGTFLRILNDNQGLNDCDVVILDEFHERHYHTDVALSFILQIKKNAPHLKIIIMSATLDLSELELLLGKNVKVIEANTPRFPLEISYLDNNPLVLKDSLEKKVYRALQDVISREGHILIFLSGMSDIRRCEEIIRRNFPEIEIIILHSDVRNLDLNLQFKKLNPKKIILSTNIAESSVTLSGVRTVIDSGVHKISRLHPLTRLPLVEEKKISQASAVQRANRAGREAPGLAVRLYSKQDFEMRPLFDPPEITRSDLTDLVVQSLGHFALSPEKLTFITPLPARELEESVEFLSSAGCINNEEKLSTLGLKISQSPFPARIAKILSHPSLATNSSLQKSTIQFLANLVEPKNPERFISIANQHYQTAKESSMINGIDLEQVILSGFFDQISKLKGNKVLHKNGTEYFIAPATLREIDANHELWLILDLDNKNQVTKMIPIEEEWLYELEKFPIEEKEEFYFDLEKFKMTIERTLHVGAIVLSKEKVISPTPQQNSIHFIAKEIKNILSNMHHLDRYRRLEILEKHVHVKIEDFNLKDWIEKTAEEILTFGNLTQDQIFEQYIQEIFNHLNSENKFQLDVDLPLEIKLKSKRCFPLTYDGANGVSCQAFIQDFYGEQNPPNILKGKEKITLHLLGPHKRAIQVTQDLESFWNKTYKEILPELKRDYPRHHWPDHPRNAPPILLVRQLKS